MARYELLLEARDTSPVPIGTVLAVAPQGIWVSPAEWRAWVDLDTRPASIATIDRHKQDLIQRAALRERKLLELRGDHMAYWAAVQGHTDFPEEEAMRAAGEVEEIRLRIAEQGWDSNWGFDEVKHWGALMFDVEPVQADGLVMPEYDFGPEGIGPSARLTEKRWRVPVESLLSGASLEAFLDIGSVYQVNRNYPNIAAPPLESSRTASVVLPPTR